MKSGEKPPEQVHEGEVETLGSSAAKTHFGRILREAQKGKRFIITHRGRPIAEIRPVLPKKRDVASLRGDMKGKIWMADDFCDPLPDLEKYFT